jgi:hypothetical protein
MVSIEGVASVPSMVSRYAGELSWLTGAGGFVWGVTNDISYGTITGNSAAPYLQRGSDTLARMTGIQVNLGGGSVKSTQTQRFNAANIINNATFAAIGLYALKELVPNKYTRLIFNLGFAPALGYGVGKGFDDPVSTAANIDNVIPTSNYSPSGRGPLPVRATGAGWLG